MNIIVDCSQNLFILYFLSQMWILMWCEESMWSENFFMKYKLEIKTDVVDVFCMAGSEVQNCDPTFWTQTFSNISYIHM